VAECWLHRSAINRCRSWSAYRCLRDFVLSRKYLEHLDTTGDLKIAFIKKYQGQYSRSWRKVWYLSTYVIFAFGAFAPLPVAKLLGVQPQPFFALFVFTLPSFSFFAWNSIKSFTRIYRGEKLVNNQEKYKKRIVILDRSS